MFAEPWYARSRHEKSQSHPKKRKISNLKPTTGTGKDAAAGEMFQMKMPGSEIVSEGRSTPPDLMQFYGLTKAAASYQVKVLIWRACLFLYFTLFVSFFLEEVKSPQHTHHFRTRIHAHAQ